MELPASNANAHLRAISHGQHSKEAGLWSGFGENTPRYAGQAGSGSTCETLEDGEAGRGAGPGVRLEEAWYEVGTYTWASSILR